MQSSIRLAANPREREQLYSFRYRIYVEEMNRPQRYADHERRRIEDPLDPAGYNLIAWEGEEVVGCVRLNLAWLGGVDYYRDLLRMDELAGGFPLGVSLCTRLMVAPDRRGGSLAFRLSAASYQLAKESGVEWNFIDCNDHLVGFFEKLGYVRTHRPVHEEYGIVNAMRLDLANWSSPDGKRDVPKSRRATAEFAHGEAA